MLYPLPLRDTLLRLAEALLLNPRWSRRIADEVTRNLIDDGRATEMQAARLVSSMNAAFPSAIVPEPAVTALEASMANHPKDRHVLAAAVAGGAETIVTFDIDHFPKVACDPHVVDAIHPEGSLSDLHLLYPSEVQEALERQAAALVRPPLSMDELLDRLQVSVPRFVEQVRRGPVPRY